MIDHEILPRYGKPSVYTLDKREKNEIAEMPGHAVLMILLFLQKLSNI